MRSKTDYEEDWIGQPLPIFHTQSRRKRTPWSEVDWDKRRTPWSKVTWKDDPKIVPPREEFVVQKNGQVRQAGATMADAEWINDFRVRAEGSLYVFTKSVLNRRYLLPVPHLAICNFLQERRPDPWRSLLQMFRGGGKTSIVTHSLPIHIHIQCKERNIYFPGEEGCEQRTIIVKETIDLAMDELRNVMAECEENDFMHALWPNRFWDEPRRQARVWNAAKLILPRTIEWPDPSIRVLGVGAAVAGKHPSVKIGDDLISEEAMNSPAVMNTVIKWFVNSRSLINKPGCIEWTIGTPWAVHDVYGYIEQNDPTVKSLRVPLLDENGLCCYPEFSALDARTGTSSMYGFSPEKIQNLRDTLLEMFPLQYMITTVDPSLTDFTLEALRWYQVQGGDIVFREDARDQMLEDLQQVQRHKEVITQLGPIRDIERETRMDRRKHELRERAKIAA